MSLAGLERLRSAVEAREREQLGPPAVDDSETPLQRLRRGLAAHEARRRTELVGQAREAGERGDQAEAQRLLEAADRLAPRIEPAPEPSRALMLGRETARRGAQVVVGGLGELAPRPVREFAAGMRNPAGYRGGAEIGIWEPGGWVDIAGDIGTGVGGFVGAAAAGGAGLKAVGLLSRGARSGAIMRGAQRVLGRGAGSVVGGIAEETALMGALGAAQTASPGGESMTSGAAHGAAFGVGFGAIGQMRRALRAIRMPSALRNSLDLSSHAGVGYTLTRMGGGDHEKGTIGAFVFTLLPLAIAARRTGNQWWSDRQLRRQMHEEGARNGFTPEEVDAAFPKAMDGLREAERARGTGDVPRPGERPRTSEEVTAAINRRMEEQLGLPVEGGIREPRTGGPELMPMPGPREEITPKPEQTEEIKPPPELEILQIAVKSHEQERGIIDGGETEAFSVDNPSRRYRFRVRAVELDQLISSNQPTYPHELQPRQRERAASQSQVRQMAQQLDPERLVVDQHSLAEGPPIVGPDLAVESGNGRVMALREAQERFPDRFEAYRQAVLEEAQRRGMDMTRVEGMKAPVLIRERMSQVDRTSFARESNQGVTLSMAPVESAREDARRLSDDVIGQMQIGPGQTLEGAVMARANRRFLQHFLEGIPANERAGLMGAEGEPTPALLDRIRLALMAKVFPGGAGERMQRSFVESNAPRVRNIRSGIEAALPRLLRAENLISGGFRDPEMGIGEDLAAAVDALGRARAEGERVFDVVRQGDLFGGGLTQEQRRLVEILNERGRSSRRIREFLESYAQGVVDADAQGQTSLLGPGQTWSRLDLIEQAHSEQGQPDFFEALADAPEGLRPRGRVRVPHVPRPGEPLDSPAGQALTEGARQVDTGRDLGTGRVVRERDILARFLAATGMRIKIARLGAALRGAWGVFKPWSRAIRLGKKKIHNVPSAMHEVTHRLDQALGLGGISRGAIGTGRFDHELVQLGLEGQGRQLAGRQARPGQTGGLENPHMARVEGVAEFGKIYVTDPETARRAAPDYFQAFDEALAREMPDMRAALLQVRDDWRMFQEQPDQAKLLSRVRSYTEEVAGIPRRLNRLQLMYEDWVDRLHGVMVFQQEVDPHGRLRPFENVYQLARGLEGLPGLTEQFVRFRAINSEGTPRDDGLSLFRAFQPIERTGRMDDWLSRSLARIALERAEREVTTGLDLEAARGEARRLANDQALDEVDSRLRQLREQVLDYAREMGRYSSEQEQVILDSWENYLPLRRILEAEVGVPLMGRRGRSGQRLTVQSPIKKVRGGSQEIIHPVEAYALLIDEVVTSANRNRVLNSVFEAVQRNPDMASQWGVDFDVDAAGQPLPMPLRDMADAETLRRLEGAFRDGGIEPTENHLAWAASRIRNSPLRAHQDGSVILFRDGKPIRMELGTDLKEILFSLDAYQLSHIAQVGRDVANVVRETATRNPRFWIRALPRDSWLSYVLAKAKPWDMLAGFFDALSYHLPNPARRYWNAQDNPTWLRRLLAPNESFLDYHRHMAGLSSWVRERRHGLREGANREVVGLVDRTPEGIRRDIRHTALNPMSAFGTFMRMGWNGLGVTAAASEQAMRLAAARSWRRRLRGQARRAERRGERAVIDRLGEFRPERPFTEAEIEQQAAFEARDLLDWARGGSNRFNREYIPTVAFLRSQIQGADKIFREMMRGRRGRQRLGSFFAVNIRGIAAITIPALAAHWLYRRTWSHRDDEVPQHIHMRNMVMRLGDTVVTLPFPWEFGYLYGTVPKILWEGVAEENPDAFEGMGRMFSDAFVGNVMPTAIGPISEILMNRDFWRNRSLVSPHLRSWDTPRSERANQTTSETSRWLSDFIGQTLGADQLLGDSWAYRNLLSPAGIENMLEGYLTWYGQMGTALGDAMMARTKSERGRELRRAVDLTGIQYTPPAQR